MSLPLQFRIVALHASIGGHHEVTLEQMLPPPVAVERLGPGPMTPNGTTPPVTITIAVNPEQFAEARVGREFELELSNRKAESAQDVPPHLRQQMQNTGTFQGLNYPPGVR